VIGRGVVVAGGLSLTLLGVAGPADAQAWLPPAGTGLLTVAFQRIDQTGHRLTDGTLINNGTSLNLTAFIEFEYAPTDRLAVSAALPYVFGKYTDPEPPPPFIPFLPIDQCRCWNSGAQDFKLAARFNLVNGPFALTPSVAAVLPSHDYPYRGESVIGRHLTELQLGIDVGQQLDLITPNLSVSGKYAYAVVEQVLGIPNNRSDISVAASYLVHRTLSAQGVVTWQRTHGGLRTGAPPPFNLLPPGEINTPERLEQHDRLLRDNSMRAGATLSYELPRFEVFVSYLAFLSGTDTHAGRAVTTGITWPFEIGH
jgi:hypothetical protein